MSDLFLGQTCTYGAHFLSTGSAYTFTFPFQVDRVRFYNYTKFGTTSANSVATWFRGMPAGDALLQSVGTAPAATAFLETTNGFTVADTAGGVASYFSLIAGVTQANPCVITTTAPNTYQTGQQVRITDLGNIGPGLTARGMDQLNNKQFIITVLTTTTFSLSDPITDELIDSTGYTAWVSGGRIDMVTRVISLNNPQVAPYNIVPYIPTPFAYDPITYKLTVGTAIMGAAADVFYIDAIKFGQYVDLGQLV